MANVKITDLTELSAADSAAVDVFPIVDVDADATKKITIASLRTTVAAANDFVTYTNITANLDIVQDNVAAGVVEATAIEARRVANIAGAVSTITTGNLDTGRALISDGSGKVAVSPVTSTEIGYVDGVTSAIQTQIDTKIATTDSASNDFITYTQLDANIDVVSANATAVEARRVANIAGAVSTITTADLTASRALVSDGSGKVAISPVTSTELGYVDGVTSAIQTQIDTKISTADSASNDFITYTQLNANINLVQDNVVAASGAAAVEVRRVANIQGAVSTITTGNLTASRALVSDGSGKVAALASVTSTELGYLDATSSVQTQIDSKIATTASASNDFVTYTRLNANIDVVSANAAAVETKRVANIAGAVSSITTADLTASRAVVSDGSGKVAVSAVTSTEIGYLDGVSSAIQTQIDSKQATITGAATTIDDADLTASRALVSDGSGKVAVSAVTATELGYVDGVTSAIQTQIDSKQATITGAATTIDDTNLTASRAVVSDGSGKVAVSAVTSTEIGYLDGVSSAIQTQINTTNTNLADNSSRIAATVTETTAVEARRVANIAGAVSTITTGNLTASKALVSDGSGKVSASAVTATELGYVDGVTSAIQTQIDSKQATITGAATTIDDADLTASRALVSDGSGKVAISAVTSTEIGYLDGVSSAIQTQIDSKQATITGAATTIDDTNLTASRAVVSDGSGKVAVSAVTSTEIGYLDGVSSAIQTQLNTKAPLAGATFTGQVNMSDDLVVTGNLTVNGDTTTVNSENKVIQDRFIMLANAVSGAPSADVGIFFNRGTSGNAALYYDESVKFFTLSETRDPDSNIAISPTGAANLAVGQFTATSVKYNGADLNTAITDNRSGAVSTVYKDNLTASRAVVSDGSGKIAISAVTSTEVGYLDGVSSAIQTQIDSKQATITGAATTIDDADLTASRAIVSDGSGKVAVSAVTSTEVGYLDGVSSAIQTQINSKQATITGAATTIDDADLTASRAVVSDGSGKVAVSDVTSTEIGYLDGVSSAIQTQINTTNTNLSDNSSRIAATVTETTAVEARRVANIAGAVSTITTGNLTASRAVVSDGSGKVAASAVTATELGYVDGVTSAIQTQIDSKQATITGAATTIDDANLTASRALASDGSGKVAVASTTTTELNQLNAITRGSLIYGNASGATARLAAGGADKVLTSDGTDISWQDPAGGVEIRGYTTATTLAVAPGTTDSDLGNLTDTSLDAFDVRTTPSYDLMEPVGSIISVDCGAF
jgi:low affinity Fe/Cu permease